MEKIDDLIAKYQNIDNNSGFDPQDSVFDQGKNAGSSRVAFEVIQDLKQLKQSLQQTKPAPVEVPEFVAEWFKLRENDLEFGIWKFIYDYSDHDKEDKFYRWFNNSDNKPIETLIRMKDGYTVEKEPLWAVKGVTDYFKCDGKIIVFKNAEAALEVANAIGINTEIEKMNDIDSSECISIDKLRDEN